MAERLDVPIYLHLTWPSPSMLKPYADYGFPLAGPPLGVGAETCLHAMPPIYNGLFNRYLGLKLVRVHLGEGLPFWLYQRDFSWLKPTNLHKPCYYINSNPIFTSSGMHYLPAFICAYMALGSDIISFEILRPSLMM